MSEQSAVAVAVGSSAEVSRFPDAYERLQDEMRALPADQLLQVNIEIPAAVTTVLGALPEIMALRPRFLVELPKFPIEVLDKLEPCALAMDYANTMLAMTSKELGPVQELADRGARTREVLLGEANYCVTRRLIDGAPLKELRGINSYRNISFDLFALSYLLRSNWTTIQGKTALTVAELTEAEQLADRLVTALGLREQAPAAAGPNADMRQRAFTLFMKTYRSVRQAIQYLSPDEVEDIAPSVHTPRGPSKKKLPDQEAGAPAESGVHPALTTATSVAPSGQESAAVGMPNSSPYASE